MRREIIDIDELQDHDVVGAQGGCFGVVDDAEAKGLVDAARQIQRRHPAGLHALDANPLFERFRASARTRASCSSAKALGGPRTEPGAVAPGEAVPGDRAASDDSRGAGRLRGAG